MVTLSWTHPEPWTVSGYNVYRDNVLVGSTASTNYADTGLPNIIESYCYTVTAVSIEDIESIQSNEACAETTDIYLEEPPNLTAQENGLEIFLDWDVPSGSIGIGDECEDAYGNLGYIDCSGVCFDAVLADSWIGDGFCDGMYAQYGVNFSCLEWSCDGCDCFGTGEQSQECIDECGGFVSGVNNNHNQDKQAAEGTVFYGNRELIGYEVFKDNVAIEFTTQTEYLDIENLDYLTQYCYNVTAVYDEGSSSFSNTACDSPQLDEPTGLSAEGTGSFITLSWNAPNGNNQDGFNIYKDGEFYFYTTDLTYEDYNAEVGIEYCYTVKAEYEGIGESPDSNQSCAAWMMFPPSEIIGIFLLEAISYVFKIEDN